MTNPLMRALLSLAGLLIVVVIVMQLTKTQIAALPAATTPRTMPAAGSGPGEPPAVPGAPITRQLPDEIRRSVETGMAARASDAGN